MKGSLHLLAFVCFFLLASIFIVASAGAQTDYMKQWPQFRGPFASGSGSDLLKVGLYGDIDEVGDRSEHEFRVYCIDKNSEEILWERLAHKGIPVTERHTKSSHANPSPATDGRYVVTFFGSDGLYCYDFNGKLYYSLEQGDVVAVGSAN